MARGGQQRIPRPPDARPGGAAPWSGRGAGTFRLTAADVRAAWTTATPVPTGPVAGLRPAAVLVPLFEERGELRLILTKRPESMPTHQGEIAFPGGRFDPGIDPDLRSTALREASEEIGLDPSSVEVVGELETLGIPRSGFSISPFVGLLDGRPALTPHPREVTAVFDIACSELLDDAVYRQEKWNGGDWTVHFYELPGETVWGATARILTELLDRLIPTA